PSGRLCRLQVQETHSITARKRIEREPYNARAVCTDMAGGLDLGSGGKRGKKPLDTAINLIPFIDLMAVTIAFLLITAVWSQTGVQPVGSAGLGPGEAAESLTLRVTVRAVTIDGFHEIPLGELPRLEKELLDRQARMATLEVED